MPDLLTLITPAPERLVSAQVTGRLASGRHTLALGSLRFTAAAGEISFETGAHVLCLRGADRDWRILGRDRNRAHAPAEVRLDG